MTDEVQIISHRKLASLILDVDFFYTQVSVVDDTEHDEFDILFGYGDHITNGIKNAYKLKVQTAGVRGIAMLLKHLSVYYESDNKGLIDIYVLEPIVDSGARQFSWFMDFIGEKERKILERFRELNLSVGHGI